MASSIQLIVGLGNPGPEYADTRHNAGFWFVDQLARRAGVALRHEGKFSGEVARATIDGHSVWLLKPTTFMNRSGDAVLALAQFYKVPVEAILVVHDELDLEPGVARLKVGGGHGGHNGLRDISAKLGQDFVRLRVGIGHPGNAKLVSTYVLKAPSAADRALMEGALEAAERELPAVLRGELQQAMNRLHTR